MKKLLAIAISMMLLLTACGTGSFFSYRKYSREISGAFDVHTTIIGYTTSKTEFDSYAYAAANRIFYLHKLFDIYNDYEGINNLKTVNDNAGVRPVEVDADIIALLDLALAVPSYEEGGRVNVALGAVLRIWHDYRKAGGDDPAHAQIPPMDILAEAAKHTDPANVIIDREAGTVFLQDAEMSLDVGSVGKGYAAQQAMEAAIEAGAHSMLINMGGNVVTRGRPMEQGKERWAIGIQNPEPSADGTVKIMDTIYVNDATIVTSGDYQRFYIVDGVRYNHIIDPETLMPAQKYEAVTVVCEHSGVADLLTTQLFVAGKEPQVSQKMIAEANAELLYVGHDGETEATEGYIRISKNLGGASANG